MAKLVHMHLIIIAVAGLALWGAWRLIRAQIERGGDVVQDESAPPQVTDADARKSDQS